MKPGYPDLTEQLDEQRSSQRKLLSHIPDRWLSQVFPPSARGYDPQVGLDSLVDRHRLESDFRAFAATQFVDVVEWATKLNMSFRSDDLQRFLNNRLDHFNYGNADTLYTAAAEAKQSEQPDVSVELKSHIRSAVALLIWADELADDGYHDPRT